MPLVAATLFEFSLRETRHQARAGDRRLAGLGWLRPGERVRTQLLLAGDELLTAQAAARRVRVERAARELHRLRRSLHARDGQAGTGHRVRRAERRAQSALARAVFADPGVAADVLRQAQILTLTITLADLDYTTPQPARAILAGLVTPDGYQNGAHPGAAAAAGPEPVTLNGLLCHSRTGLVGATLARPGDLGPAEDGPLIEAAAAIVLEARKRGVRLSQAELARQLRACGLSIANDRLRWLAGASGLGTCQGFR